jgi:phosphoserine phosphatase
MRDYARAHDVDLAESWAYTDSYSDYPMLAVVGHPTAVNPDLRLRSVARSYDWPVLDLS